MKNLLNNVWADLRAKRLWPVAVLLLAGLVAVPVVLKKSAEEPPAASVAVVRKAPEPKELKGFATVQLEQNEIEGGSTLNTFDPSNPFSPPKSIVKNSEEPVPGDTTAPATADGETTPADTGAGTTGGDDGSTGDDGGSGDDGSGDTPSTTTLYTYVIDVTFTANGRTRKIKGMQKLDMLPNETNPLLLFLGVSPNGGNAVFLVDSTLETAGEGKCKPSKSDCAFVYLGAGSEQVFTDEDGKSYDLAVDQIRKVKLDATAAAASEDDQTASAAVGTPTASRRFVPPLLSDLVSVSSTTAGDSDSDSDRR